MVAVERIMNFPLRSTYGAKALVRAKEEPMVQQLTIGNRVLEVVRANPGCTVEAVTQQLQDVSWTDVFIEVDRLRRSGNLRLFQSRFGSTTTLRLP